MSEDRMLAVLRKQAWERAKGEMMSMDHTYYDDHEKWERFDRFRQAFITMIEDSGFHE